MTNPNDPAIRARIEALGRDMLRHAHLVTAEPDEQVVALVTAATVAIERHVGPELAAAALLALTAPTVAAWAEQAAGVTVQ